MALDTISISIADNDADGKNKRVLVGLPAGHTDAVIQAFADEAQERVDRTTEGEIMEVTLTKNLTLLTKAGIPGAGEIKDAPTSSALNEVGGLFLFSTSGPRRESVWLPAFPDEHMTGEAIIIAPGDVQDFLDFMTIAALYGGQSFQPKSAWDYSFSTLSNSKRAVRRK